MLRTSSIAQAVTALDEKLRRETKRHLFWSRFMGEIQQVENFNNDPDYRPSDRPIEVNNMMNNPGLGDRMLIPMTMELSGLGRLGDAVMLGHEEDIARKYAMVHYNQIRHGVPVQKGKKEYNIDRILNILEDNVGKLGWWHAQMENWQIITAIYLGTAEMLHTSATDTIYGQGLGLDKRVHPNLYSHITDAAIGNLKPATDTVNGYASMQDVYESIRNDTSTNGLPFTTSTLRSMRKLVYSTLNLKPTFTHSGQKYWAVLIDPIQADTLMSDAMFKANGSSAPLGYGLSDHPDITGSLGIYGNFVIFEDPVAVRGYYTESAVGAANGDPGTSGTINVTGTTAAVYDTTDKVNPRFIPMTGMNKSNSGSGNSNRGAIIMGGSMLGKAQHSPLSFETENFDYNNWKGLAAGAMYGYERLDFVKEADTPTYQENSTSTANPVYNRSSAVILTFQD